LWPYLVAYAAVILAALEVHSQAPTVARVWGGLPSSRRALLGGGLAVGVLTLGLDVRGRAPELFARWSGEEGIWEPLTLAAYLSACLVLFAGARSRSSAERRQLHLFAIGFLILALEEIDYFGIFGAFLGRVNGIYVGSPHDLIGLAAE